MRATRARAMQLGFRAALLVAMAVSSPAAGFILHSLARLRVGDREQAWIKSRAIAMETVDLAILLAVLQPISTTSLGLSLAVITGMMARLPLVFRFFALFVRPQLATERAIGAVELFASFFIPFYFLKAGLGLRAEDFGTDACVIGGAFLIAGVPLRIGLVAMYRRLTLRQPLRHSARLGVALLPTLVFTLVIAELLRDQFDAPAALVGGFVLYALVNTVIPGFILQTPTEEYEAPEAPEIARLTCAVPVCRGQGATARTAGDG